MVFVGIDYSIASPAISIYEGSVQEISFENSHHFSLSKYDLPSRGNLSFSLLSEGFKSQEERFNNITKWALNCLAPYKAKGITMVGIEDYSFGSKGRVFNLAENTGLLKHYLWNQNIPFFTIPPSVIKKFATGKGNAKKDAMLDAFLKETNVDLKHQLQPKRLLGSPTTDIVDAYFIMKYVASTFFKPSS